MRVFFVARLVENLLAVVRRREQFSRLDLLSVDCAHRLQTLQKLVFVLLLLFLVRLEVKNTITRGAKLN